MSRRNNDDANPLFWIIFLIALYISAFFIDTQPSLSTPVIFFGQFFDTSVLFGHNVLSAVLAGAFLLVTAVALHVMNNSYASGLNFILPLLYLVLSVANPNAIYLTPFHIAAFLLVLSMEYFVKFKVDSLSNADIFVSILLLAASSLFFPPLIWLLPFLFISGFGFSERKVSYIVASVSSVVASAGALMGTAYLVSGTEEMLKIPAAYAGAITDVGLLRVESSPLQLCRDGLIFLLVIVAAVRNIRNQGNYRISESRMLSTLTLFTVVLYAIIVLFLPDIVLPYGVIVLAPASVVIFGLFGDSKKTLVTIFGIIIIAIILAERTIGILDLETPFADLMKFIINLI